MCFGLLDATSVQNTGQMDPKTDRRKSEGRDFGELADQLVPIFFRRVREMGDETPECPYLFFKLHNLLPHSHYCGISIAISDHRLYLYNSNGDAR